MCPSALQLAVACLTWPACLTPFLPCSGCMFPDLHLSKSAAAGFHASCPACLTASVLPVSLQCSWCWCWCLRPSCLLFLCPLQRCCDCYFCPSCLLTCLQPLPLWADVQQQHRKRPLHVMLAGGNQVVQDSVFAIPALQDWLLSANDEVSCTPSAASHTWHTHAPCPAVLAAISLPCFSYLPVSNVAWPVAGAMQYWGWLEQPVLSPCLAELTAVSSSPCVITFTGTVVSDAPAFLTHALQGLHMAKFTSDMAPPPCLLLVEVRVVCSASDYCVACRCCRGPTSQLTWSSTCCTTT